MFPNAKSVAERMLSELWQGEIHLGDNENLGGNDRSNVYRFSVLSDCTKHLKSIIVKQAKAQTNEAYEPQGTEGPAWRLFNDWDGLQVLTKLAAADSLAPQFYGGATKPICVG